jgi:predicted RNase H-like HicB family nuclease
VFTLASARISRSEAMEYIAYLHKDRASDYGVSFPDFPGCITAGKTLDEARRMAPESLALHIKSMTEDGDPIPEPSQIEDIADDAAKHRAIAFMVSVDARDATVRVNITARERQIQKIDELAEAAGMTRSGYMVSAALRSEKRADRVPSRRLNQMRRSRRRARA